MHSAVEYPKQFQDSPLGRIPTAWQLDRLESVSEFVTSGSRGWAPYYSDAGPHFIRIGNLTREHINLRLENIQHVKLPFGGEGQRTLLLPGDLLISITADLGIVGIVPNDVGEAYINQHIALIRLHHKKVDCRWIGHFMAGKAGRHQIRRLDDSGAKAGLNLPTVRALLVALPPLPEQHHIAEILDTIDKAILKTEQLIQKLKQMKQGFLHDLLTRGVDENGELRDPARHPEQFRDSPLGRIPNGWTIDQLRNVGDWLSGGTPSKSQVGYWGGGVPWVCPKDMKRFVLDTTQETLTDAGAAAGTRFVPPGSIFLVVRGMILAHTFPVCLAATRMAFNQDVKGIVPREGIIGRFLAHWFLANSARMLGIVTEATHGTKRIDLDDLHRQYIAIPGVSEQQSILAVLETHNLRLALESSQVAKMRILKVGLMEDLLTGRVRTTIFDGAAA